MNEPKTLAQTVTTAANESPNDNTEERRCPECTQSFQRNEGLEMWRHHGRHLWEKLPAEYQANGEVRANPFNLWYLEHMHEFLPEHYLLQELERLKAG